jgi:hypothetical protein
MKLEDFIVFIGTHGRPNNVYTYKTIRDQGYTGDICLLIDNEDQSIEQYKKHFPDNEIYVFDKQKVADEIDVADNFPDKRSTVYFRTASFEIAKKLGKKGFVQLDDDYLKFYFKVVKDNKLKSILVQNLNNVFLYYIKFLENTNVLSIAMAQGGDYCGGMGNTYITHGFKRKAMNSFFCLTDRPFKFCSKLNEDVNTYLELQRTGAIFLTNPIVSLIQVQTQLTDEGMSTIYREQGTYVKSFYSVIYYPSAARCSRRFNRIHHTITWDNVCPVIIRERIKNGD